jgi:pimeloyl-ACP methyl ester carboxylesterase
VTEPLRAMPEAARPVINWHEGGSGPALVLVNGWSCSGLVWPRALVQRLEQRFRVIRPDNRGSGWSRSAPAPFLVSDLAYDVESVLDYLGHERATVLGLSLGSMVGIEFALRRPERVDRLVIVAGRPPVPDYVPGDPAITATMLERPRPGELLRPYLLRQWTSYVGPGFAAGHPELMSELVDALAERVTPRALMLNQLRAILGWGRPKRLRDVEVPTVVVHGAEDRLSVVRNGMLVAQLIPGAEYVELPEVGHVVHFEAQDRIAEILERS